MDQLTSFVKILKKRIEYEEEQEQKTQQSIGQTIQQSARIAAGNGLSVLRKLYNPTLLFCAPTAAAAPPRVPTTAAPIAKTHKGPVQTPRVNPPQRTTSATYFGSGLPTALFRPATPPRVQPPQLSPRLAEQAANRVVTYEILREKVESQKDGPAQRTRSRTRSIAQEAMLACVDVVQLPMSPLKLAQSKYPSEMINAVLN